jgi:hypothetical protein
VVPHKHVIVRDVCAMSLQLVLTRHVVLQGIRQVIRVTEVKVLGKVEPKEHGPISVSQ